LSLGGSQNRKEFLLGICKSYGRVYSSVSSTVTNKPESHFISEGMWHSDKPAIQQELANRLAELMVVLPDAQGTLDYIRAFHWTILKEWHSIDKLRLDKFYSLIRFLVFHSFKFLASKKWKLELAEKLAQILIDLPLNTARKPEVLVSPGVAFHLADIYVDELEKACKGAQDVTTTNCPLNC